MLFLFGLIVEVALEIILVLDAQLEKVLLDNVEQEFDIEFEKEGLVQRKGITFEYVQNNKYALLIKFEETIEAAPHVESERFLVVLILKKGGHVAQILEEGSIAKSYLVIATG